MTNAARGDLNDFVRIALFSASSSTQDQNNVQVQRKVSLGGIETGAISTCRVVLTPSNYRVVHFFIMLADRQKKSQAVTFPVEPTRVADPQAPVFAGLSPEVQRMLVQSEIPRFVAPGGTFLQGETLSSERPKSTTESVSAQHRGKVSGHSTA